MTSPSQACQDDMTDADDMAQRAKQLAKDLLEALDRDPEPESALAEARERKEREDNELGEAFYVQTGQKPRRARNKKEMQFAAELQPCPHCGMRELGQLRYQSDDNTLWLASAICPSCGRPRSFNFTIEQERWGGPYELGPGPSLQILPAELRAELGRVMPFVKPNPQLLSPTQWYLARDALVLVLVCLHELVKLTHSGPERDRLIVERDRLLAIAHAYSADADRVWKLDNSNAPRDEPSRK
jgi:hypothetical protein